MSEKPVFVLILIAVAAMLVVARNLRMISALPYVDVDVEKAYNMIVNGSYPEVVVLDVRNQSEYDSGHIYDAVCIPVWQLETRIRELINHKNHEIIVYCRSGRRSVTASEILEFYNFTKVYNMLGGILAWESAGYPVWIAPVHNIDTALNYDTIQAAIDAAETLDGHTILVDAGTHCEDVIVYKSISLIGENRSTTVIDGNGKGNVIDLLVQHINVTGFTIRNGTNGVLIRASDFNTISGNILADNLYGIHPFAACPCNPAQENTIRDNIIKNNSIGICIEISKDNIIHHNNFINNTQQVYIKTSGYANFWDNGFEGNYWSNYTGVDSDHDGIGEAKYIIDENNQDNHPLMGTFLDFTATSEQHVQTICNSTISGFRYNGTAILFNVSGKNGTAGFCRVCLPIALMNNTYRVFVNGAEVSYNLLPCSNKTHSYLYFIYNHSTQEVIIIPEFPSLGIVSLFMVAALLAVIIYRKKHTI